MYSIPATDTFTVDAREWSVDKPERGRYAGHSIGERIMTAIECPYCHEPMGTYDWTGIRHRIVCLHAVGDVLTALGQRIPDSHHILSCRTCEQQFTVPRSAL